jgi:hypothetical protein
MWAVPEKVQALGRRIGGKEADAAKRRGAAKPKPK